VVVTNGDDATCCKRLDLFRSDSLWPNAIAPRENLQAAGRRFEPVTLYHPRVAQAGHVLAASKALEWFEGPRRRRREVVAPRTS
jgi:hypothetical protein